MSARQHIAADRVRPLCFLTSILCNICLSNAIGPTLHGTEYKITSRRVCVSVCVCAHGTLGPNISKRAGDRGMVTMGHE